VLALVNSVESSLVERARSIAQLIGNEAIQTEQGGTLAPPVVQAFRDTELFWALVPREYGGLGATLVETIEMLEEVSAADGSSGWSLMANTLANGMAAAFLQDEAVEAMFGGGRRSIAAGMLGPGGNARLVDGGYVASGNFSFASGGAHADWFCAGMFVLEDGKPRKLPSGIPEVQGVFMPRDRIRLKGNWDVLGLCGTGSYDYEVPEQFIPTAFALERTVRKPLRGGSHFKLGAEGVGATGHMGVALGLMKHALREIARIASSKKRPAYPDVVAKSDLFRADFAFLEAQYLAARRFALQTFGDAQDYVADHPEISEEHRQRLRQACTYVHMIAADVVRKCHMWSGSEGLRNPSAMGRCLRDMYVATQHIYVDPSTMVNAGTAIVDSWLPVPSSER
jgi:indole-3-acetate monooxygenase